MKLAAFVVCGAVSTAAAQPSADPGAHRHDGIFVRAWLGPGYTSMKRESTLDVSGAGGSFGIAAGVALQENLIVFGQVFDDIATNPTVEVEGESLGEGDFNAGVVVGAGVSYYFMPSNIYVAGALTATKLTVQHDGDEIGDSDFGPGVSFMVGKEWWVSNNVGLGVALHLFGGDMEDDGTGWFATAAAIAFSATYN
jgi:hypothetical protein